MGQINCQCQQAIPIQNESHKYYSQKILKVDSLPTPNLNSISEIYTEVLLTGISGTLSIKIRQGEKATFGTTDDCQQTPIVITNNSFKLQFKMLRGCIWLKDCGVGYGVFLFKKKLSLKSNGEQMLLSIEQNFLLIRITQAQIINYSIFGPQMQKNEKLTNKNQYEIMVGQTKIALKRQKQGKEYSIKRHDKKQMCLLASQQKKLKQKDIVRLGLQFYTVQSITDYIESSKVVQKI